MTSGVVVRAALGDDRAALERLVGEGVSGTAYRDVPDYFLRLALAGRSDESRAIVAVRAGAAVGCALFGPVAGAVGSVRIHFIAVAGTERRTGTGRSLCTAILNDAASHGTRSVIVEMPDEAVFDAGHALLESCGFAHVARVADYYRDGVALVVMHHAIAPVD
ncbi:MAG TPA: GNAT family N-acetyltransferase [Gemmatimonadaceae bacterium]|nr:GNAT family N-acetyltransferase [Gemmatimonadaceae bacterium]